MIVYKNASFFLYIFLSKAQSVAGRAAGSLGFAHENRIHWLCGQPSAIRAGIRAAFSIFSGLGFAHENRILWLCGQPSANRAGTRAAFSIISGLGFAHENRKNILQSQNVI